MLPDAIQSPVPNELLEPVVAWFKPRRVYLFGSTARGEAGPNSDLDLLVVVDDDTPSEIVSWRNRGKARKGYRKPVDIVPCTESAFADAAEVCGTLPFAAITEGILVYERPDR